MYRETYDVAGIHTLLPINVALSGDAARVNVLGRLHAQRIHGLYHLGNQVRLIPPMTRLRTLHAGVGGGDGGMGVRSPDPEHGNPRHIPANVSSKLDVFASHTMLMQKGVAR